MEIQVTSLYELNNSIRNTLSENFNQLIWIKAETSDVRVNQNGHCYLELIEKDSNNKNIIAKARASIWSNVFKLLKPYFESESGQQFTSGLSVLIQASVEFHELYGFSLNIQNIDPTYTLGDQTRKRAIILKQLEEEGVLTLNKELELTTLTNRIAIISSPTAAGYEDFCDQLNNNNSGFIFYTHLFPTIMQGERTEDSIIAALDKIYNCVDLFDAVVIIRGGGAASELSCFDSYLLAANCAQFPLPIITGIGHERDETVLDIVAHTRAKTPTAVAEFLIKRIEYIASGLLDIEKSIYSSTKKVLSDQKIELNQLLTRFSYITRNKNRDQLNILAWYEEKIANIAKRVQVDKTNTIQLITNILIAKISNKNHNNYTEIENYKNRIKNATSALLSDKKNFIENKHQYLKLISPENILKKGYTLTLKNGKIIKTTEDVKSGDKLVNRFQDGDVTSIVE